MLCRVTRVHDMRGCRRICARSIHCSLAVTDIGGLLCDLQAFALVVASCHQLQVW
jgi:hypothetical protein